MQKPKIITIIPAYNEEKTITKVIKDVKNYSDEIIVIDDGSKDKTVVLAKEAGAKIVSNIINRGLGTTIRKGYQEALKEKADIIIQIDADGQYTASDIPKLIQPIINNQADLVIASRFLGGIEHMPIKNKIGNKIGTIITNLVAGIKLSDAQSGFRAMRKELLEEIIPISKKTYVQEMIIRSAKEGWRIKEIPSYFKKRESGKSRLISNLTNYAKNAILIILRMIREYHPLLFFGAPGIIILILGLIIGAEMTYTYLFGSGDVSNRTGTIILSAFLMLFGFSLIFLGYLADMIEIKYLQLKEEIKTLKK